jgi:hypothetical protein
LNKVALLALVDLVVDHKVSKSQKDIESIRGPRGLRGPQGEPFNFAEHEQEIKEILKSAVIQFDNLTDEQLSRITGPAGQDGKDFSFEENEVGISFEISKYIDSISDKLKLKFDDLDDSDKEQIKGRDGRNGRDGKGFSFEEHEENIKAIVLDSVKSIEDKLKLKFSDLSDNEIDLLRGPQGRDGRDGKSFSFEEHREYFESLKPKFSDFTDEEKSELKLKFLDLSKDEVELLKLKFTDLTKEDKEELTGPRGQRGKRGPQGEIGEQGLQGLQGLKGEKGTDGVAGIRGIPGLPGPVGRSGINGLDGKNAPVVVDVELEELAGQIRFTFLFSDGSYLVTNWVSVGEGRKSTTYLVGGVGSANSGGSAGKFQQVAVSLLANTWQQVNPSGMEYVRDCEVYDDAALERVELDIRFSADRSYIELRSRKAKTFTVFFEGE